MHLFQVQAGSATLVSKTLSVPLAGHPLVKRGPHTCEDKRAGGGVSAQGLESLRRGSAEQDGAGIGAEALGLLNRPEGHGAQVLHLLVAGRRVVTVTAQPADLGPFAFLGGEFPADAFQLFFRTVAVQAGVEEGAHLAALVLLVLQLVGGQGGQDAISSSLFVNLGKFLVFTFRIITVILIAWGVRNLELVGLDLAQALVP